MTKHPGRSLNGWINAPTCDGLCPLARELSRVIVGGMTLAVPGSAGFVALAQRAVIGYLGLVRK
jgi:hypothetical protein